MKKNRSVLYFAFACSLLLMLSSCASFNKNPDDPFEPYNRSITTFNDRADTHVFKPVAELYDKIFPWPFKRGVTNFFNNLDEIPTFYNDVLQLHIFDAVKTGWRFVINSTFGIGGLVDVASYTGLERHSNDLGLTFAQWGYKESDYFVIPFAGPSTVRDTVAAPANFFILTVVPSFGPAGVILGMLALKFINLRASLFGAEQVVEIAALDPYIFIRDAYLQHRHSQIYGGSSLHGDDIYIEESKNTTPPLKPAHNHSIAYAPRRLIPTRNTA